MRQNAVRRAVGVASTTLNAVGLASYIRGFVVRELVAAVLKGNFSTSTIQSWVAKQVDREVTEAIQGDDPIIVGPWLMEVGFELLYWIPFLRQALAAHNISPDRVVAVSRGGTQSWYADIATRYVDVFDLVTQDEFLSLCGELESLNDGKKPFEAKDPERNLCRMAAERLGVPSYATIFPASMYKLFRIAWTSRITGEPILPYLRYRPIETAGLPEPKLPFAGDFVAAKYYFSESLPPTEENRSYVRRKLTALASAQPVVLLNTGLKLDDHEDAVALTHPNIFDASKLWTARDNLAMQTAIVAKARRLYGTYGGFSYLGPLLGVPTEAVFSATTFVGTHLDLALRALTTKTAGLTVTSVQADRI